LTAGEAGDVRLWDRADHQLLSQFSARGWLTSAAFRRDGRALLIGLNDGPTRWWEAATGKPLASLEDKVGVWSLAFSPDGHQVVHRNGAGARLRDCSTGRLLQEWSGSTVAEYFPDGTQLLLVAGGFAQVWDVASGRATGSPRFHPEGGIKVVAFSP